jgi:hypothetical protein
VAVSYIYNFGDTSKILTSSDGIVWSSINFEVNQELDFVTYAGGLLIAVGTGTIITSQDGVNWTRRISGTTESLGSVTWTGDQFVAVGSINATVDTNKVLFSPDGENWTGRNEEIIPALGSVAWTGTNLVAIGSTIYDTVRIITSTDGLSWTPTWTGNFGTPHLSFVTWTDNQLIAIGYVRQDIGFGEYKYGSYGIKSPDGQSWTNILIDWLVPYPLFSAIWTGSKLVVVGEHGTIITSSDYKNWTIIGSGTVKNLWSVAKSDNLLVAVGDSGTILTSPISTTEVHSAVPKKTIHGLDIAGSTGKYFLFYSSAVSIRLYNLQGRLVKTLYDCTMQAGPHVFSIPSGLAQGNYILSFSNGQTRINKNILIEK